MIEELKKYSTVCENIDLINYNTYKVHSICKLFITVESINNLKKVINILNKNNKGYFIIGNGSNIILKSEFDKVVIKLSGFNKIKINNNSVYVEANYMLNKLSIELSNMGYSGFEWSTGIPGTIGGSIYNNAGAYNSSISDLIISVNVLKDGKIIKLDRKDIYFDYRDSLFKQDKNYIILSCNLKLVKGDIDIISSLIKNRTSRRIESQDLNHPSCGSVFRNPNGMYAGKLIEELNLKGYSVKGASISEKHANFIINKNNATGEDIIKLINKIKKEVKTSYNIDLILEQEII